jgi:RimJ/RimL family protein N-acetyltransferase
VHSPDIRIETERLILRLPEIGDFDAYAELMGDADAARFIGGPLVRAAAWRKFLQMPGAWALQGFGMFAVVEKSSGNWLGQLGPWHPEGWPGNEVGWSFRRSSWGHGYATEAAVAAIDWAFDHLDWTDIIHCIDPDNHASQALAHRLGSRNLGPVRMPPPYEDSPAEAWGQTRDAWRARRRVEH